jgi:hypothetical protein
MCPLGNRSMIHRPSLTKRPGRGQFLNNSVCAKTVARRKLAALSQSRRA